EVTPASHCLSRLLELPLSVCKHIIDRVCIRRSHESIQDIRLSHHLHEFRQPRQVQLLVSQAEHKEQASGLSVERIKVYSPPRAAQHHEGFCDLLGMSPQGVQKCHATPGCTRHDILTLNERSDKPRIIAYQT